VFWRQYHLPDLVSIEVGGRSVGLACAGTVENERLVLPWMFIHREVAKRGLGRKAMSAFERHARALGAKGIVCTVDSRNTVSLNMVRSLGYRDAGSPTRYWLFRAKNRPSVLPLALGGVLGAVPMRWLSFGPSSLCRGATLLSGGVCRIEAPGDELGDLELLAAALGCNRLVFSSDREPPHKGARLLARVLHLEKLLERSCDQNVPT
jgi:hypothetical protein